MCSHLLSLRDVGTPATQDPPPNDTDTVTYSVLQKRPMVRGQSYGALGGLGSQLRASHGTHMADNEVGNSGSLKSIFHCCN